MKTFLRLLTIASLLLAPVWAMASDGYVTRTVNLRAGPDSDYPRIMQLPAGSRISILGCIDRWEWCDVVADGERGWVDGRYVQSDYRGRRVYVHDYGDRIGIPIVSFILGAYWREHYDNRPWFEHRDQWAGSSHGHRPRYAYPSSRVMRPRAGDRPAIEHRTPAQPPNRRTTRPGSGMHQPIERRSRNDTRDFAPASQAAMPEHNREAAHPPERNGPRPQRVEQPARDQRRDQQRQIQRPKDPRQQQERSRPERQQSHPAGAKDGKGGREKKDEKDKNER